MQKAKISLNQAIFSIVLFNFSSSVVIGVNTSAAQDAWLSILAATVMCIPVFLMYARIIQQFPEKNLFEISGLLFGKIGGKIITLLFVFYSITLAAIVMRNFSEFTQISSMPETPQLPIMILLLLTTIYLSRSGIRAIGKWSVVVIFFVVFVVVLTFVAIIHHMRLDSIRPIMEHTPRQLAHSAFQIFSFPYAESVMFLCVANGLRRDNKPYKMFMMVLVFVLSIFLLIFFRNLTLLGRKMMEISFFPSYVTARIIGLGDFFARIESAISSNFLLAGIVKISVCLLATANGLTHLFNLKDHRIIIIPIGLFALALCSLLYQNTMQMMAFIQYYPYFAFPFQIIIPIIIFIAGEIYIRKRKKQANTLIS